MRKILEITDFSQGLVTDPEAADIPNGAGQIFKNMDGSRRGMLKTVTSKKTYASGISGITLQWFAELRLNETDVLLAWGTDGSSYDRFYYSVDTGSNWVEITEFHTDTFASGTASAPVLTTGFDVGVDPSKWFAVAESAGSVMDYITAYDSGTKTLTMKYGILSPIATEGMAFFRFPIWPKYGTTTAYTQFTTDIANTMDIVGSGRFPALVQRQDAVGIYNQVDSSYPTNKNWWFGYINKGFYDDNDLDYSDYHAEMKRIDDVLQATITNATAAANNDALPAGDYGIRVTIVTDDGQESHIHWDADSFIAAANKVTIAAGEAFAADLNKYTNATLFSWFQNWGSLFSRRIKYFRIYLTEVEAVGAVYKSTTDRWYMVEEIDIDSATWAGTSDYTYNFTITGTKWEAGQQLEHAYVTGYDDRHRVNAGFGAVINGREVALKLLTSDFERHTYAVVTPVNFALRNVGDVIPEAKLQDLAPDGITDPKVYFLLARMRLYLVGMSWSCMRSVMTFWNGCRHIQRWVQFHQEQSILLAKC